MPESSIAQSILSIGCAKLKEIPNADAVLSIHIIIAEESTIKTDSLQIAFDKFKQQYTGCSSCKLNLEVVDKQAFCRSAKHNNMQGSTLTHYCDKCGNSIARRICGEELEVIKITLHAS